MTRVVAEYFFAEDRDDSLWIDVHVNGLLYDRLGPFDTDGERKAAMDDILAMSLSIGAVDLPNILQ